MFSLKNNQIRCFNWKSFCSINNPQRYRPWTRSFYSFLIILLDKEFQWYLLDYEFLIIWWLFFSYWRSLFTRIVNFLSNVNWLSITLFETSPIPYSTKAIDNILIESFLQCMSYNTFSIAIKYDLNLETNFTLLYFTWYILVHWKYIINTPDTFSTYSFLYEILSNHPYL